MAAGRSAAQAGAVVREKYLWDAFMCHSKDWPIRGDLHA
jgi:hypothetical protein